MKTTIRQRRTKPKQKSLLVFSFLFFCCLYSSGKETPQPRRPQTPTSEKGWQVLFDGNTLTGWKASTEGYFSVEDGAITGTVAPEQNGPNSRAITSQDKEPRYPFLVWQGGKVTDFNLRFKARLLGGVAHAGLHFRGEAIGPAIVGGYQADISEFGSFFSGLLGKRPFEEYAAAGQSNLINSKGAKIVTFFSEQDELQTGINWRDWVTYEIRAQGPHIVVLINDRKMLELIDQREVGANRSGVIALSLHPLSEMKVQLKDIELQRLSPNLATSREMSERSKHLNLIERLRVTLDVGPSTEALAILQQTPQLKNVVFGILTGATYSGGTPETPLLLASARGHVEVVKWLITNGAAINQACYNGFLPIHLAASAEIAHLLIAAGANLETRTSFGDTPLQYAASSKRADVVDAILTTGYKLDLVSAIRMKRADLVTRLIQMEPSSVNVAPKSDGDERRNPESPLMIAVRGEEIIITQLLLNAGAEINYSYELGGRTGPPHCGTVTPLSIAVVFRNIKLIELLLQYGANPQVDCDGNSLIEYARKYRSPEIVALLEKEWPRKAKEK